MIDLSAFFVGSADPSLFVTGFYSPWLVALSVLIASIASGLALQIAGTARSGQTVGQRQTATLFGSLALGGGVWSMHFIGMLAFDLCTPVVYDPAITLLSMLPSLFASWVALQLLARDSISRRQLVIGGTLVGAGAGTMHYTGMAAMTMGPALRYDPLWFGISIVVAVGLAIVALWIRFGMRRIGRGRLRCARLLASALVMGLAIAGMHYTGMAAARFVAPPGFVPDTELAPSFFLAVAVSLITIALTILAAAFNGLLRYQQLYRSVQDGQSRLQAIVDTAVDGIVTIDDQGLIQAFNQSAENLFGWRAQEVIGRNVNLLMPENHARRHDGYLSDYLRSREPKIIGKGREVMAVHKSGRQFPIRLAIGEAKLPDRSLFVGFISDITVRKAMEASLREREEQYSSLIRNIPGVSFRCNLDADWSMVFISEAVESLTGWAPDAFIANTVTFGQIIHGDDRARLAEVIHTACDENRTYQVEYRIIRRDGMQRWVQESGGFVRDAQGQARWIDGVIVDVTETKLRNAEFAAQVAAIDRVQAVVAFDLKGRVLSANRIFLDMMGYELAQIVGQHHRLFQCPEAGSDEEEAALWARVTAGEPVSGEFRRRGRDGRTVWTYASYNPVFDADGRLAKVVEFATDVTERKTMEAALVVAKERAEQAAIARTTFLANMSHEIRTPMNAIIGFSDLLINTPMDPAGRRHMETIRHSARSLLGLINDILDTAKLERGAIELERIDFSLRELIAQIAASLGLSAHNKGLVLRVDYAAQVPSDFKGDPLRVQQILTNLVGNAVKFTQAGSVDIAVSHAPGRVRIAIRDTGIGIPTSRLEAIFDPFSQADASMSRRFGGTGLGTTIARQLVELMGGRIEVASREGEGSTFTVELPLEVGEAVVSDPVELGRQLPPLRILVADDMPQNIELLQILLGRGGHTVVAARDGQEAVQALTRGHFDVVLMDVQMPGVDGLEATRRIRAWEQLQGLPPVPIVALSASVQRQDQDAARDAGMNGFASKPLELQRLLMEIGRVTGLEATIDPLPAPAADPDAEAPLIDWSRGIRFWGDASALSHAIRRFCDDNRHACVQLERQLACGNLEGARQLAHRLHGAAGNLSLARVHRLGSDLEQVLREGDAQAANGLATALSGAFAATVAELRAHGHVKAEADAAGDAPAPDWATVGRHVETLVGALRRGEIAEDALDGLGRALGTASGQARLSTVQAALDDFDFERAIGLLGALDELVKREQGCQTS
jgi:PAS domain S-box-containing protein